MQCLDYSNTYQDVLHSLGEDGLMSFISLASAGLRAGLDRMLEDGLTIPPGQEEASLLNSSAVWDEQLDKDNSGSL